MKVSFFRSIRAQLLALVLISVLPALAIILYSGLTIQKKDIARAESDVLRVVSSLDDDHERIADSTQQFLLALARFPDVQNQNVKACNRLFAELLKENPIYANIFSATAEGMVFSGARPFTPHSIRDRKYYQDARKTKDFSVGEYVIGVTLKKPVLHFAYPVRDGRGGFKGIVAVAFDLNRYGHTFPMAGLPPGSRLTLSDHKNRVIYRYPDSEKNMGKVDNPDMIRSMSSQSSEGIFMGVGHDGIKCLYGYKRFYLKGAESPYLFLRVGIPEEQALSYARNALILNLALLGAALLIAMVLAWFLGSQLIVQKMKKLVHAAQMLRHGDFQVRTGLTHSQDELGILTKAFDEMAGELESREDQRKSAQEALRTLYSRQDALLAAVPEIIVEVDNNKAYTWTNSAGIEFFGEDVIGKEAAFYFEGEQETYDTVEPLFNGTEGIIYVESWQRRKDGEKRLLAWWCRVLKDTEGNITGALSTARDITELKRAEENLKRSEALLAASQRIAHVGSWELDLASNKLIWSDEVYRIFGLEPQEFAARYEAFLDAVHPEDRAAVDAAYKSSILEGRDSYEIEHRIVLRNTQEIRFVYEQCVHQKDASGHIDRSIGMVQDITGRKLAEGALRENEARLRTILDATPFPIALVDTQDNNIDFWSHSALTLFGHTAPTAEKWYQLAYPDPDYQNEVIDRWKPALEKAQLSAQAVNTGEYRVTCRDGSVRICDIYAAFLTDRLIVTFNDITDRKRAEEDLRESEERYRMIFNNSPLGVMHFDTSGTIIDFNDNFAKIMGAPREKILGFNMLERLRDQAMLKAVKDALDGRSGYYEGEYVSVTGQQKTFQRAIYQAITSDDGTIIGAVGIFEDITERKKIEHELNQYRDHLEELVRISTTELARSNADLEQFAYVASHDLQEPLRMVASFTQLLAKRYKGKLDANADEFISFAVDGANRMQRLINDLLSYSRVTTRQSPFVQVDCHKVLDSVIKDLALAIDKSGAAITCDPLPTITGDPSQLGQVFQNLISNAIKFRSDEPSKVHISAELKDNDWVFSVRDNGIGFDSNHFERIFVIFQRLNDKKEASGTGIGLAICKKIVENHGGRIWVESRPGEGSTFYFTIPRRQGQ